MTKVKITHFQQLQNTLSAEHEEKQKQLEDTQQALAATRAASAEAQVNTLCFNPLG